MNKKMISVICAAAMAATTMPVMSMTALAADDTIKIGVFEPQTGENGGGGLQELQGARYANEIRPTVKVNGKEYKVELDEVDNKSDKTEAVTAFADAKIPAIGASCTNPQVTSGCDYYFRVCFLDPFQGSVMAQYAFDSGYKNVAVIDQIGDDYSTGLANFFVKQFQTLGGAIATEQQFQTNQSDFKAILAQVKAANADAIFAPSSIATAPLIIKQAREMGIDAPIMAGDTWYNQTIIDNAGAENAEGTVVSTFFDENDDSNPVATDFVKGYKEWLNADKKRIENNGGNDAIVGNSALCFDTYNVICDAIEAGNTIDGEALKDAISKIDGDYVTGHITFNETGDANKDSAYIDIAKDGKFQFLKIVTVGGGESSTEAATEAE